MGKTGGHSSSQVDDYVQARMLSGAGRVDDLLGMSGLNQPSTKPQW